MNWKNILLFSFLLVVLAGLTLGSVSATMKVPTKYKIHTYTNNYYESDTSYYSGIYYWEPRKGNFNNPVISEKYSGSKTKIQFYTYNNNGNKYHWVDVKSSTLKVYYRVKTSTKTYYKSKTVKYTKIPKYGLTKTLTLKGPSKSKVLIYRMKWTQVNRVWNNR